MINDEVVVAFEHGDTRRPIVVGFLYNGRDKPPGPAADDDGPKSGPARSAPTRSSCTAAATPTSS